MCDALGRGPVRPLRPTTLIVRRGISFFSANAKLGHMRYSSPPLLTSELHGSATNIDWPGISIRLTYGVNGRLIRHFVRPRLDRLLDWHLFILK
jgi:hypothetical protein